MAIAVAQMYNLVPETSVWSSEDVAKGIQDYLICIEMFIASIAHSWVFHYDQFQGSLFAGHTQGRRRR